MVQEKLQPQSNGEFKIKIADGVEGITTGAKNASLSVTGLGRDITLSTGKHNLNIKGKNVSVEVKDLKTQPPSDRDIAIADGDVKRKLIKQKEEAYEELVSRVVVK